MPLMLEMYKEFLPEIRTLPFLAVSKLAEMLRVNAVVLM